MKRFLIALQFLTILPVRVKQIENKDYGKALFYFPFVGAIIGILISLPLLFSNILPKYVIATFILLISIILTGAIHLDGLADSFDGFYGGKTKKDILDIMRDKRIGVVGAIALFSVLILKYSLYLSMSYKFLWKFLILSCCFSRWMQSVACSFFDYAREEGKAKIFIRFSNKKDCYLSGMFVFLIFILLAKFKSIPIFLISLFLSLTFMHYINKKIDGMTGDTIGAINELAEISILLFALGIISSLHR